MAAKTQNAASPTAVPADAALPTAVPVDERRKEERHFICYGRPLYVSWLREESLLATLVEVSRSGFRLAHQYRHFSVGQEVRVSFPWGPVRAKVAWTRVGRKHVQTGFSVIEGSGHGMLCPK